MTSTVRILRWLPGLKKISLAKLLRQDANMSLDVAHDAVNRLLDGNVIEFTVSTEECARRVTDEIRELGAEAGCVESEVPTPS